MAFFFKAPLKNNFKQESFIEILNLVTGTSVLVPLLDFTEISLYAIFFYLAIGFVSFTLITAAIIII